MPLPDTVQGRQPLNKTIVYIFSLLHRVASVLPVFKHKDS